MRQGETKEVSTLEKFTIYLKRFNDEEREEQRVRTLLYALEKAIYGCAGGIGSKSGTKRKTVKVKRTKLKWRRLSRKSISVLHANSTPMQDADGQLQDQMSDLVRHFEMADSNNREPSGLSSCSYFDIGRSGGEAKTEGPKLQEEKTQGWSPIPAQSRSSTLGIYHTALKELLVFFTSAKYVYVALFSAPESPKHSLIHYRFKRAELQALQLLQLLRPSLLEKIVVQRDTIAKLSQLVRVSRDQLVENIERLDVYTS